MKNTILLGCSFAISLTLVGYTKGDVLYLGTAGNAVNWSITGAGATGSPAFPVSSNGPGEISITSNGFNSGTFVTGGSLAAFDGFWYADEVFFLPANALDVTLSFDSLYGNDRVVLELNGTIIGNADHLNATGTGVMAFAPGPPDISYAFTGATFGTVTSGFLLGDVNELRLLVNNTGLVPITAPTATFRSDGARDATGASVNITLNYSVPEPSTDLLFGIAAMSVFACIWQRRRCPKSQNRGLSKRWG